MLECECECEHEHEHEHEYEPECMLNATAKQFKVNS